MTCTRQETWNVIFEYRHGVLYWRKDVDNVMAGLPAGFMSGEYLYVRYLGKAYAVHKVIYEMHHGDTEGPVDHRNRNKLDNLITNLRKATKSQNEANTEKRATNTSGYKGVYWLKNARKWRAKIDCDKQQIHIGLFECKHAAAAAYNSKAAELFGEFANLNTIVNNVGVTKEKE